MGNITKTEKVSVNNSNVLNNNIEKNIYEKAVKKEKTFSLIFNGLLLIIFFLPIIFSPVSVIGISVIKFAFAFGFFYLLLFFWSVIRLKDESFSIPLNYFTLGIILVPLSYIISTFFSENFSVSFFGRSFNFDSTLSIITLFIFLSLAGFIFKDKIRSIYVYSIVVISSIITLLLNLVYIFFGSHLHDLGYFIGNTTNTLGRWFDFGVFAGLGLIISIIFLELSKPKKQVKISCYILFTLSLASLLIVGFTELWMVIGIFSLGFFIYHLVSNKVLDEKNKHKLPVFPLIVFVIAVLLLISGNGITGKIQRGLDINFNEVRPSFNSTFEIIKHTFNNKTLLGYGPQRFNNAWIDAKPDQANLTEVWNSEFNYGYSFIMTSIVQTGVVGLLSWMLFFGLFIWYGLNIIFKSNKDSTNKLLLVTSFVSSLYLWIVSVIYVPSFTTMFMTFVMTSLFVASLYRNESLKTLDIKISEKPKYGFIYIFLLVAVLITSLSIIYKYTEYIISETKNVQGIIAFNQNDLTLAQEKFADALNYRQTDILFRNLSDVQQLQTSQIQNLNISDGEKSTLYQGLISNSITNAISAINYDPTNYNNYLYTGSIFSELINLKVEGASLRAIEFTQKAYELNPKNPLIALALARIELRSGNNDKAKEYINQAIELKPNYVDAVYLLSQINIQEGEVERAIENVRLTTLVRPDDPVTYFQLGLLQYQNDDYESAVPSFEAAVIRNRFFSNAKYFLGLSYYQIDRKQDAINQFKDLNLMFPENQEIVFILNNLNNGRDPFYGADNSELDINKEPEKGEDLPVGDSE